MEVKVSVILPSLNVKDYIERAVRSVSGQTLREIEIICIDAGSDDGTWEILSKLAETDERIILCHSDMKSYGYQVNMGIDMAKGEYIAILETDDYADSRMYERLYEEAVSQDCDCVKSDYFLYRTQDDGKQVSFRRYSFLTDDLYGKVIEPIKYPVVAVGDWYLWTGVYKKKFLVDQKIRLSETPGAAYQDIGFMLQTNILAKRSLYVKEAYYRYCVDREGASANSGRGLEYTYQEFLRFYGLLMAKGANAEVFRAFYCRMAKAFIYCCEGMEEGHEKIDDAKWSEYYAWFRKRLNEAMDRDMVDRNLFRPEAWKKLEALLVSETYYLEQYREHKKKITDIIGRPGEYSIIIFGCGHYGYEACKWLESQMYRIVCFIDNNQALWGTKINNIAVESPREIVQSDTAKYLIANEMHSAEMKEQLLSMGIMEKDICIYI